MLKRTGHISPFGQALDGLLNEHDLREPLRPHTARVIWDEVVGPEIAAASGASAVRGGVLFVTVRSAVWANELAFYKKDILDRLNDRLGGKVISDIHFKVSGRTPPALKTSPTLPDRPDDEALRDIKASGPLADAARRRTGVGDPNVDETLDHVLCKAAKAQTWKREHGWIPCRSCGTLFDPAESAPGTTDCLYCLTLRHGRMLGS
ncbi:MAG: DUF721 domain-containing protein [Capsulimonadaceae bacterium]|nr:DUF721 domain-containing protein [Capsulimonadaceae bacterium]